MPISSLFDLFRFGVSAGTGALLYKGYTWLSQRSNHKHQTFPDQIMVVSYTIEELPDGTYFRPRALVKETNIHKLFDDPVMAADIVSAAKHTAKDEANRPFVVLSRSRFHSIMMKQVVHIVSELARPGHIARMFDHAVDKNYAWCFITYEPYGTEPVNMLRIHVVSQYDLWRFCSTGFVDSLKYTPGEGSHVDGVETFRRLALLQYGARADGGEFATTPERSEAADKYLRFVMMPTPKLGVTMTDVQVMLERAGIPLAPKHKV
jgi:hypothetical protein